MNTNTDPHSPELSLKFFLPLLASMVAVVPLAIDMYLPAMTTIASDLDTDITKVQLTLSLFLAGYALGLLVFGSLADIYGRRTIVLVGLTGYSISSTLLAFSTSIEQFMALRLIQAFLGAAAVVPVAGYVKVIYGKNMAKGMSYLTMIMMFAPMVAPTLGIVFMELHGWTLIFIALGGYAALLMLLSLFSLPKVPSEPKEDKLIKVMFRAYAIILGESKVRAYLIMVCFGALSFFGYLTAIPFVYMEVYQVNEKVFGVLFAVNVLIFILGSFVNTRMVTKFGSVGMVKGSLVLSLIGAIALVSVNYLELSLYWTVASLAIYLAGLIVLSTNTDALVLLKFPELMGTANGVIGTVRFGFGALAGPLLAFFYDGTAMPFSYLVLFSMVINVLCFTLARKG